MRNEKKTNKREKEIRLKKIENIIFIAIILEFSKSDTFRKYIFYFGPYVLHSVELLAGIFAM